MANKNFNITSNAITWEVEETEITQDEIAFVNIACSGYVDSKNTTIDQAIALVPQLIPINANGPVRLASTYRGAELQKKSARFGEGNIQITATYRKAVGIQHAGPGGGTEEVTSASDKTSYRISNTEEPLLTHPVALLFSEEDKRMLKNLMEGDIKPNDEQDKTKTWASYEYVKLDPLTNEWSVEAIFNTESKTAGGITASPSDYAKLIVSGIITYKRPTVVYNITGTRETSIDRSEVTNVGTIVSPPGAFSVPNKDWIYDGVNQDQITDANFTITREFSLSGAGGFLKQIYLRGTGDINA